MKGSNNNSYNSKNKNRKRFKPKANAQESDRVDVKSQKYNDPSWYVANGQLLKDFASLSFNNALGAKSRIEFHPYDATYEQSDIQYTAPGIMTIMTAPAFGISNDGSSAINLAAKNFYTWIRHQNSGHANYDSPDLMLYFGAMDSIYSMIASMMRAYGTARTFSQVNRYIGDALLQAQGYKATDIRANLADFRGYINMVIAKASAFCTPITMTMFKRHFWMYSGIYRDEDVVKSQAYMYVPALLWSYEELDGAGYLKSTPIFSSTTGESVQFASKTFAQIKTIVDGLLAKIVSSEDINIMSGDILKAYGRENLWNLSMVSEDYAVFPVYSQEVLDQIHNTNFAGSKPVATLDLTTVPTLSLDRLNVIQNPEIGDGSLFFVPQFMNVAQLGYDAIIDMSKEDPTPEDVMVASRNILTAKVNQIVGTNTSVAQLTGCGSDICLFANIITMGDNGSTLVWNNMGLSQNPQTNVMCNLLGKFNKYPRYITIDQATHSTDIGGELDNYTVVCHDDIQRMHDTAVLSLLGVPFLGTASSTK